jgi:4-diphosphocytidyl-2-C-methyl-D-erythritol kinase
MADLRLKSYAKINLSLRVLGIREDLFHEIDSLMQSVSLYDEISLEKRERGIDVMCDDPDVPRGAENISSKAARAFLDFVKIDGGVGIGIKKSIPLASGLAGGSSNAAATLIGLDRLFNTGLSKVQLSSLGEGVGSDVPFCLVGGRCRVRGRGEIISGLPILPKMHFVLVVPDVRISTKWAYEEFDRWSVKARGGLKPRAAPADESLPETMRNDFEEAISLKHPVVGEVKRDLLGAGALSASLSGSGPSVFGLASDEGSAQKISREMKNKYPRVYVVSNVNEGVRVI